MFNQTKHLLSWLAMLPLLALSAQQAYLPLPANINHPGLKGYAPFISLDGQSLLFLSRYAEDQRITIFYSARGETGWRDPAALPRHINHNLNFTPGFALTADGRQVYVSNARAAGLGGYDLYFSDLRGSVWSELQNAGAGVNTALHEAAPSFSADGNTMYFMRCNQMDATRASGCSLFVARKRNTGAWDAAVALPAVINTGNSQMPRIMGDGETLIFSSNQFGGKGGMEFLLSRYDGKTWSTPVLLDFVNTAGDDLFASATALGRYLLCDRPARSGTEMAEVLFPPDLKPKGVMRLDGQVAGPEDLTSPFVYAASLTGEPVYRTRPRSDGTFRLFLPEGRRYDVSVEPLPDAHTFFSAHYDLSRGKFPQIERVQAVLGPVQSQTTVELNGLVSDEAGQVSLDYSREELRRLERLLKANPAMRFTLEVELTGYREDSVNTDPELTEVRLDTLRRQTAAATDTLVVRPTYHNDTAAQQGLHVLNHLLGRGVPAARLQLVHRARPGPERPAQTRFRLTAQ
jgi:hypothetical protein